MREESAQLQPVKKQLGMLKLTGFDEIWKDMGETFDAIAKRAYELFELMAPVGGRSSDAPAVRVDGPAHRVAALARGLDCRWRSQPRQEEGRGREKCRRHWREKRKS